MSSFESSPPNITMADYHRQTPVLTKFQRDRCFESTIMSSTDVKRTTSCLRTPFPGMQRFTKPVGTSNKGVGAWYSPRSPFR